MEEIDEIKKLRELQDKFKKGLELTFRKLIMFKKQKNSPFVFSREGKIVYVSADEVEKSLEK